MPDLSHILTTARIADVGVQRHGVMVAPVAPSLESVFRAHHENVRLLRPDLADLITTIPLPPAGVPRDQITVPISPLEEVSDAVLFEAASDAGSKMYLPRYRLSVQNGRYRLSLEPSGQEWMLVAHLEKYLPPEIEPQEARGAQPIDHAVTLILTHQLIVGGTSAGQKELVFQEVMAEGEGLRAVLRVSSLPEHDRLYHALTDPTYGTTLNVRRALQVAISYGAGASVSADDPRRPSQDVHVLAPVPRDLPEGTVVRDHRAHVLAPVPRDLPEGTVVRDHRTEPLFREVTRVLDNPLDPNPFVFPPALHGYIFSGSSPTAGQGFRLLRQQVGEHSYYQDPVQSELFYYLPDCFKVARRPQSPHLPMMRLQFTAPAADASPEAMQALVNYAAMPWTDPERLVADAEVLRERFMQAEVSEAPVLEPLLIDSKSLRFVVGLPHDDPTAGPYRPRDGALVDLRSGIHDMLVLRMPHFQSVFDAMFSASAALFDGRVEIDLGEGSNPRSEVIPFAARMNDLAGDLFDYRQIPDEASGGIRATFKNAIESPVRINRLSAILHHNDSQVPGILRGFSAPVQLGPGEEATLVVAPATPIPGADPLQAIFDLGDVEVLADREKIWEAILDPATSEYWRMIRVKTFPEMFDAPAGRPKEQILEIDVELKRGTGRGTTVALTANQPEAEVGLPSPISDYILRREDVGEYSYRFTVIRQAGPKEGEWKTNNDDNLWIFSADVN